MLRSIRVTFDTQETITPETIAELFEMRDKVGWLFFLDNPEAQIDKTKLPKFKMDGEYKTPGERLRATLYRVWELNKVGEFETFYASEMERIISHYKEKLN